MTLTTPIDLVVDENITMEYVLDISALNNKVSLYYVEITCVLPGGLTFKETDNDGKYNDKTKTVTWKFDTLDSVETIVLRATVDNLPENTYSKQISVEFTGKSEDTGNTEFKSNKPITITVCKDGVELTQSSTLSDGVLKSGEEITYTIIARNLSSGNLNFVIKDYLPNELTFVRYNYSYTQKEKKTEVTNNYGTAVVISPIILTPYGTEKDTITINLTAKAEDTENTVEITNRVVACLDSMSDPISESTSTYKLVGKNGDIDDPNNPKDDKNATYDISGTAWLDENKDGKRDDGEELLSNIKIYLLDSTSNKIISETSTNKNGAYTFEDVKKGNYIVAFDYDNLKYDVTLYRADGADNSVNSDTVTMELKLNNETKKFAVTDTIVLNTNTYNIDLGLIDSPKFDLNLTKGVSLVQVSNSQGTKTYNFNGKDNAKVEIAEKYMVGSVIAITYNIDITNTGAVPGYVNKVVDYKAKDLSFSSVLNPEWYEDTDGNIYNTSLVGREIKPGETVQLSVILTKTMTSSNIGVSNNTAEIAEASNDLGLEDIDSVPGNKNAKEDDYGLADVYITIKTGGLLLYGFIVVAILGVFAFGAYEVNKKILRKI
ncbi:MAG: hypothetical protein K2H53_03315 [Clostridia bacterium]|nr:hypothetical protein [Clostridia bacterium]